MASVIPAAAHKASQEADLSQSFWQRAAELGALDEQQRLDAIERGWSSNWLAALRKHLHLKTADLEPLLAFSEATMARRDRGDEDFVRTFQPQPRPHRGDGCAFRRTHQICGQRHAGHQDLVHERVGQPG